MSTTRLFLEYKSNE
jgi:U3 small nucleolar RNA-associated protein 7